MQNFPFGGGVRRCLGTVFATYEIKVSVHPHPDLRQQADPPSGVTPPSRGRG
ncbi:MAG: cytochrome P450 [Nitrospirae bacterium]|nr:cytochrome P450 [Nitrospirota bacterium]